MVQPAGGTPGAAGPRVGPVRELWDESNGSRSVAGACTSMTKRCPKSMVSSVFCWKFRISQR